jgi:hypothetical protein
MPITRGESDVDGAPWPPPAQRAEAAHARADELRRRRAELASGVQSTADVVAHARRRAKEAVERAVEASRAALHRHVEAVYAHLRAAAAHEQAAMTVGDEECDTHQTAAEQHRAAAALHQASVTELSRTAAPGTASAGVLHQK